MIIASLVLAIRAAVLTTAATLTCQGPTPPIPQLHLVEYGDSRTTRDDLIRDGGFIGDLGRYGIAHLTPTRHRDLATRGIPASTVGAVYSGEVLVVANRRRTGTGPIHGRLVAARRAFFVTAIRRELAPQACGGVGFHGGIQRLDPRRPYRANPAAGQSSSGPTAALPTQAATLLDPRISLLVGQVELANLQSHVQSLAAIHTRHAQRAENAQAVSYILAQLSSIPGLTFQTESFDPMFGPNIIAEIPGTEAPDEIVMVGAHFDSIVGGVSGLPGARSPGADDNASGTAAVLEIVRLFATQGFRRTVRFGFWNAEEFGVAGSTAYATAAATRGDAILAYINTDMNSHRANGDPRTVDYVLNNTTASLTNTLVQATQNYVPGLGINTGTLPPGASSDHAPFFQSGFPSAFPFEDVGQFSPFIHSSNDDVGNSANDFHLSRQITQSIVAGLAELAQPSGSLGSFEVFGAGCAGTGTPPPSATHNRDGGTLSGAVRTNEYAYQVPAGSLQIVAPLVESFELYTQSIAAGARTVDAYLYADAGVGPAANPIATTTITIGTTADFYRAVFAPPVAIPAGATFYLAVDQSAQDTVISTLTDGEAGSGHFRRPALVGTWAPSTLVSAPAFRVHCANAPAVPTIGVTGMIRIDDTFSITLDRAAIATPAFHIVGFTDQSLAGLPLPIGIPGAPGCALRIADTAAIGMTTDLLGRAVTPLGVPDDATLVGVEVFHQWLIVDPGANTFGVTVSAGAKTTIGE